MRSLCASVSSLAQTSPSRWVACSAVVDRQIWFAVKAGDTGIFCLLDLYF
jgi:hypothetical protein